MLNRFQYHGQRQTAEVLKFAVPVLGELNFTLTLFVNIGSRFIVIQMVSVHSTEIYVTNYLCLWH